jgi:hypothetical protein
MAAFTAFRERLDAELAAKAAPVETPAPKENIIPKVGTPTWNYAYDDNRTASVTGEDGKEYFFVPQSYVQKGQVQGDFQQYNKKFLDPNTFKNAVAFELPEGMQSRLENKGFLWPADEFNKLGLEQYGGYTIDENNPPIVGLGNPHPSMQAGAPISYITQPKLAPGGERVQQDWITAADGRQGGLGQYAYYKYQGPLADAARGGLQAIGPLAPILLEYAAPGMGLGFAYSAGNAAGKLATGQPGAAESLATSVVLSQLGVGSGVAEATGSTVAGQVAQGTATGLLTGKTPEQALTGAVQGVALDSLMPNQGATVRTEQEVLAGQQDLQNQLAPFEVDTTASSFDTKDIIDDGSGFTPPTPTPQTPITGNTGGNIMDEDTSGLAGFNTTDERISDDPYAVIDPTTGQYQYSIGDPEFNPYDYQLAQTAQQTATQSGLKVSDVLNFFKSNPNVTKGLISAGISGAGGLLTNQANVEAARISAQAMRDAAATAAEAQKFRPVGVTTRFGASQFGFDPATGQLTSAGYQLTPELKAMQDRVMALTGKGLTEAELAADRYSPLTAGAKGLFGLGQQYLAQSPEQVAADYMARQQDLLAPSRERQLAQLQTQLFNTGRGGLSVGGTGMRPGGGQGLRAASPEMEAYYNALAQQDAQLAAGAQQAGQQQVQFGAGLMGTGANLLGAYGQGLTGAYAPFSTGIGVGSSLESLGQAPLDIGAQLGGRSAQAGANVGQTLLQGGLLGARTTQAASGVSPFGTALTRFADSPEAQQALLGMFTGGSPDQYEQRAGVPFTQRNVYG